MKETYQINVDGNFDFKVDAKSLATLDIVSIDQQHFHILKGNKAYKAEIIHTDFENKSLTIKVNGTKHQIQIADQYDMLIKKMGLNAAATSKMNDLKAPMPGLVLDVLVDVGQTFDKGTPLLILEAMKMENIIKATGEGTVKSISTEKGNAVDKGQVLLELE